MRSSDPEKIFARKKTSTSLLLFDLVFLISRGRQRDQLSTVDHPHHLFHLLRLFVEAGDGLEQHCLGDWGWGRVGGWLRGLGGLGDDGGGALAEGGGGGAAA